MSLLHLVGHDGTSHGDDALAVARTVGRGADVRRLVVHVVVLESAMTTVASPAWFATLPPEAQEPLLHVRGFPQAAWGRSRIRAGRGGGRLAAWPLCTA